MITQANFVKFIPVLCFSFLINMSYATEKVERVKPIAIAPIAVDIVVLCPEGSQHEGELVPKWVTNDEATEFFCNDAEEETELAE